MALFTSTRSNRVTHYTRSSWAVVVAISSCFLASSGNAFVVVPHPSLSSGTSSTSHTYSNCYGSSTARTTKHTFLQAKKKQGKSGGSKGFGKQQVAPAATRTKVPPTEGGSTRTSGGETKNGGLQNVELGGSDAVPSFLPSSSQGAVSDVDPNMPVEERTKQILKERYGLKTLEEQETDRKKREARKEERKKQEEWNKKLAADNFDFISVIPAPLLIFVDRFLKFGVAVSTLTFVAAGIAITAEAWAAASGQPLPENVDQFIVGVVESNFTPGLLVLLGFSVSLGIFASVQLGSAGSQYSEDN